MNWRDVSDWAEAAFIVKPVDPFEGGHFDIAFAFPGSFVFDELGLVQTVDGLGHGIVIAVADASH